MRHRLRLDELERLAVARSRGYLLINPSTRTALKNAWHLDRTAASQPCIYVERTASGYRLSGIQDAQPIMTEVSQTRFNEMFSLSPGDRDLS
jgi:hypothetical protein